MSIYCSQCGQPLPDEARFCIKCGTRVQTEFIFITSEYRENFYKLLPDAILSGLETDRVSVEDSKESVSFILDQLDKVQTKSELAALLKELAAKWPAYQPVYEQFLGESAAPPPAPMPLERPQLSAKQADNLEDEVDLILKAGQNGEITDEIFKRALAIYDELEGNNPALFNYPKKNLIKAYLQPYHDVRLARHLVNKRWEDDRKQKQRIMKIKLFSIIGRVIDRSVLVVEDYRLLSKTKVAWEFIDSLELPDLQTNLPTMILLCPCLLAYFDWVILKDLFIALLMDNKDPREYEEEFARIKQKYGRIAEQLVEKLTTLYSARQ